MSRSRTRARGVITVQEAGRRGGLKRWADAQRKHVKLSDLTPDQRRLVLSLIESNKKAIAEGQNPAIADVEKAGHVSSAR